MMGQRIVEIMLNPLAHLNYQPRFHTNFERPCIVYETIKEYLEGLVLKKVKAKNNKLAIGCKHQGKCEFTDTMFTCFTTSWVRIRPSLLSQG